MSGSNSTNSESSEVCAGYLKALADPVQLQIVRALQSGPLSVTQAPTSIFNLDKALVPKLLSSFH